MDILICAATRLEIQPSLRFLKKAGADVLITGVGAVVATYALTKAVRQKKYGLILQAGIAGCFDKRIALGTVLAVSQDGFGDLGVQENGQWKTVFDLGFADANKVPYKQAWLKNPYKKIIKIAQLNAVPGITVNEVSTNKKRMALLKESGAVLESMEGAALHYVALMEKIPFLQIRAVSNYAGERDKAKWNFKDSITNLNTNLTSIYHLVSNI